MKVLLIGFYIAMMLSGLLIAFMAHKGKQIAKMKGEGDNHFLDFVIVWITLIECVFVVLFINL